MRSVSALSGGTALYGYNVAVGRVDSGGVLPINNDYGSTTVASRFDLDPGDELQLATTCATSTAAFAFPPAAVIFSTAGKRPGPPGDQRQPPPDSRTAGHLSAHPRGGGIICSWERCTNGSPIVTRRDGSIDCRDDAATWNDCDGPGSLTINSEYRLSADYSSDFFLPLTLGVTPTFTIGGSIETSTTARRMGPVAAATLRRSTLSCTWRGADAVRHLRLPPRRRGHVWDAPQSPSLSRPDYSRPQHQTARRLQPGHQGGQFFSERRYRVFPAATPTWRPKSPRAGKSASTSPSRWASWTRS